MKDVIHCIPSYRLNLILVEIQIRAVRLVNHSNKKSIRLYFASYKIQLIISHHMINHMGIQFYGFVIWKFALCFETTELRTKWTIDTI